MFTPSREDARRFFIDTWSKYRRAEPLTDLEKIALELILLHPEYQPLLDDPERALALEFTPETGRMNPFLHLALHLAVEEQLTIDQPPGLRARFEALVERRGSVHDAKHDVLECLGEVVWQAQRTGGPPDGDAYLECLARRLSSS
jgi:hypothetical protein